MIRTIERLRDAIEADEARRSVTITLPGLAWQDTEPAGAPQRPANDNSPATRWPLKRALARADMLFGTDEERAKIERAAYAYLDILDPRPDDWLPPAHDGTYRGAQPFIHRDPAAPWGQEDRHDRSRQHRVVCRFLGGLGFHWHAAVWDGAELSGAAPAGTPKRLRAKAGSLRIKAAGLVVDGVLHEPDFSPRQRDEIIHAAANDWWAIRYGDTG